MGNPGLPPEGSEDCEKLSASTVGQRYLLEHLAEGRPTEELIGGLCQELETLRRSEEVQKLALDRTRQEVIEKELREREVAEDQIRKGEARYRAVDRD